MKYYYILPNSAVTIVQSSYIGLTMCQSSQKLCPGLDNAIVS
jgi:hypothetical protein